MALFSTRRAALLGGSQTYNDLVLGTGPIAYWPQDDPTAPEPNYLTFNGTSTVVDCGSDATLDDLHDDAFTAEIWARVDPSTTTSVGPFMNKGSIGGAVGWDLRVDSGRLRSVVKCAVANATSPRSTTYINDDVWHHLAMTWDDAGDRKVRIYINGTLEGTSGAGNGAINSDAAESLILGIVGANIWGGAAGWCRISDSVRYAPAGFTPPARLTIPTVDANTVSLWPMNEGHGTTAGDIGANDNDGTITAGSWPAYRGARCLVNPAQNGTYTGVTLGNDLTGPFGTPAPFYDGVNDYCNIYTATLVSAFDGDTGSALIWGFADNWANGDVAYFLTLGADANNWFDIRKNGINSIRFTAKLGGAFGSYSYAVPAGERTIWLALGMTWAWGGATTAVNCYVQGAWQNTFSPAGQFTGNLAATTTIIGASATTPAGVLSGHAGPCPIWDRALPLATMTSLSLA